MLRRLAILLLALATFVGAPATAVAADADALDLIAQSQNGGLSETPRPSGGLTESASPATPAAAAEPSELPFTGTDPRITLLLGLAALLAGAGLRLRTGDARDF